MTLIPSADLEGFAEAQQLLRDQFGEDIDFYFPEEDAWPAGTQLDPESGQPFDPTVLPVASAIASTRVSGNLSTRITPERSTALGFSEVAHSLAILPSAAASAVDGAEKFRAREELYKLVGMRLDGIGGIQRLVVAGSRM